MLKSNWFHWVLPWLLGKFFFLFGGDTFCPFFSTASYKFKYGLHFLVMILQPPITINKKHVSQTHTKPSHT